MNNPKRCYIAGPMRGYENFNFDAFDQAKDEVAALGYHPISPADIDRLFEGWDKYPPEDWEFNMPDAINMILRDLETIGRYCDAIYMLRGWPDSSGSLVELAMSNFKQIKVIEQPGLRQ